MRVHIAADHAGLELKTHLIAWLSDHGYEVDDHGAFGYDELDDYPAFCFEAAEAVAADPGSLGVVVGGSGNGEQMAANKVAGVRAALIWSTEIATLAREHNDANVGSIGARMHTADEAVAIVETFLTTAYSDADRHTRRIGALSAYEASA